MLILDSGKVFFSISKASSLFLGEIVLKKLELNRDFLMFGEMALDIEGSMISEVKINIPWSNITSSVISFKFGLLREISQLI